MANAGKQNGTLTYITNGGTKIDHSTEVSLEIAQELIDCTTKDSAAWKESLAGLRSINFSGSAYYAEDASEGFADMLTSITGRTSVTLRYTTGETGDQYIEVAGYITSLSNQAGTEDVRSYDYSFEGSGAPTVGLEV